MKKNMWAASVIALIAFSSPSLAQNQLELTLDAYMAMIKAQGGQFDYSAKNVGSDGSVEYRDLKLASGDGSFGVDAQWLRATPNGDAVTVTLAPSVLITMTPTDATESSSVTMMSQNFAFTTNALVPDPTLLEMVDIAISADELKIADLTGTNPFLKDVNIAQTGLEMSFTYDGPAQTAGGSWKADTIAGLYAISMERMESSSDSSLNDFAMNFSFDIANEESFPQFLTGEKDFSAKFETSGSQGKGSTTQEGMSFAYESTAGASSALVEIVGGMMTYSVKGVDATMLLTPQGMPMPPVNISMKEIGMDVVMPFNAVAAPAQAMVALKLGEVAVGEELWSMIDPGQTIARDPLNIDINMTSMIQVIGDLTAAMAGAVASPTEVVNINDLTINSFLISAAGASVIAGGALTFDNSGPIPMPLGTLNVEINGAQGLSQKLVELGLVDAMQSGMAMGMIMSFAKPGAGADQFTSEIEFKDDGSITANGQPLPM